MGYKFFRRFASGTSRVGCPSRSDHKSFPTVQEWCPNSGWNPRADYVCYTFRESRLRKDAMDTANVVEALMEQRTRIDQAIVALEGRGSPHRRSRPARTASSTSRPGRHMSAAARKRISAAMKMRWAKRKGKSASKKAKGRPPMSAAAKKKLSELMKARWAAKQKAKG